MPLLLAAVVALQVSAPEVDDRLRLGVFRKEETPAPSLSEEWTLLMDGGMCRLPERGADLDEDGEPDLFVADRKLRMCSMGEARGKLRVFSGRTLADLGAVRGIDFDAWHDPSLGWVLRHDHGPGNTVVVRPELEDEARWRLPDPWAKCYVSALVLVPDIDGDGRADVVLGRAWYGHEDETATSLGTVELRSGADGRLLWRHAPEAGRGLFGLGVAPAGDRDSDGCPDLAVLDRCEGEAPDRLVILSGLDGRQLGERDLATDVFDLHAATDADGDGFPELVLDQGRIPDRMAVLLSAWGEDSLLELEEDLLAAAGCGDTDGDGLGELFLATRDDEGETRLVRWESNGTEDLGPLPSVRDDPVWTLRVFPGANTYAARAFLLHHYRGMLFVRELPHPAR